MPIEKIKSNKRDYWNSDNLGFMKNKKRKKRREHQGRKFSMGRGNRKDMRDKLGILFGEDMGSYLEDDGEKKYLPAHVKTNDYI